MYIDFDNTGENLRLITIEEMVNSGSKNSTRSRCGGNTIAIYMDGHIFIFYLTSSEIHHQSTANTQYEKKKRMFQAAAAATGAAVAYGLAIFTFTQCIQQSFLCS